MRIIFTLVVLSMLFCACRREEVVVEPPAAKVLIRAMDASFFPEIDAEGYVYRDAAGQTAPFLSILKSRGVNTIRIRLWVDPPGGHSGFEEVRAFSEQVHGLGFRTWLSVHYSDAWADPAQQARPLRWQGLSFPALKDSVHAYTARVAAAMAPDYVQIGNEVNSGMLHPAGEIGSQPGQFRELLAAGLLAVREQAPACKSMVHFAGTEGADWFFGQVADLDFDMIGISYYPIWHGKDLDSLATALGDLAENHGREVVIAETAYPFTLSWADQTGNIVGEEGQLVPGYPASPAGQKAFLERIRDIASETPGCLGFCYWAPEWVAFRGPQAADGSAWENQALFDFDGKALPAFSAFD